MPPFPFPTIKETELPSIGEIFQQSGRLAENLPDTEPMAGFLLGLAMFFLGLVLHLRNR
jgi:hypothetical protein